MASPADASGSGTSGAERPGATLGILAGGGSLPMRVAEAAHRTGREVFVFAVKGHASQELEAYPHVWLHLGEVGRFFSLLSKHNCAELVIVGGVVRPELKDIRLDFGGVANLPRIVGMMMGGDDHLLVNMVRLIEERGVRVVGAHEISPDLALEPGPATRRKPARNVLEDIELGRKVIAALGPYDVGQSVVVDRGRVIAIEAAEGTDAMLARCATLREAHTGVATGVLVKAPKPGQELRVDLPTIGDRTVEGAARARLAGIAARAGKTLVADKEEMLRSANRHGLFVYGFGDNGD